jgi:hypothetical protein
MAALDVSAKISRFKESFLVLERGLTLHMERETMKTVLEIREKVDRLSEHILHCFVHRFI